ncbi:MAG: nucleotide-binding universal stress UspA family protein [Ilumatobacter sp.]|jgi:nucleotide-binding universal stress UspA family protein
MGIIVLLCTDGSEIATVALRSALPVLAPADRVVLLTVESLVDPDHQTGTGFTITQGSSDGEEQIETSGDWAAKTILDRTVAALGLEGAELFARSGEAGQTICDVAAELPADVVVMGTGGRSGFRRAMVGSTSDHVVRHAVCPVLVQGAG